MQLESQADEEGGNKREKTSAEGGERGEGVSDGDDERNDAAKRDEEDGMDSDRGEEQHGSENTTASSTAVTVTRRGKRGGGLPLRPGKQDCEFFLRTGHCSFGRSCRFNHDPNKTGSRTLNSIGLPVYDGVANCNHFVNNGSCNFGWTCKFSHPGWAVTMAGRSSLGGVAMQQPAVGLPPRPAVAAATSGVMMYPPNHRGYQPPAPITYFASSDFQYSSARPVLFVPSPPGSIPTSPMPHRVSYVNDSFS